jgi:hypothetical protein
VTLRLILFRITVDSVYSSSGISIPDQSPFTARHPNDLEMEESRFEKASPLMKFTHFFGENIHFEALFFWLGKLGRARLESGSVNF